MSDYYQVKNQNIFNPPANTYLGNATNQFNSVYVQNDLVLGNVTVTGSTIVAPKVSTITYPGDDTAADTAGGQTITLTGAGFVVGASVLINGSAVSVVSVVSSTTITFTSPANSTGSYVIYVINPDGSTAIAIPGIQYSGTPNWTTAAGSLGNVYETASFNQTVTATGDAPITYSVYSGTLPPGATFNSNGTISGTSQLLSSPTTYTFTIRATDAQQQDTNRSFSLTVTPDVVTWSNPTDNTTYSPAANVAIANITLSATSAVGSGITYSANTLPTGLSLTGANISGTPTVVANTSSLLTATANTTSESSSITINWVVSVASDPYFMYNTLLLPGNGSNGAQNNTFLDSSTNNFTITRNGNTTQGTFSPYGANWSNYLTSSNYLSFASSSTLAPNTNSFTMEFWYNSTSTGNGRPLGNGGGSAYGSNKWVFASNASATGKLEFAVYNYSSSASMIVSTSSTVASDGLWHHIAIVRSVNTWAMFIDGTRQGSTITSSVSFSGTSSPLSIGWSSVTGDVTGFSGYISNFRFVNGSAVYDPTQTTITVPTSPLTAIANTALLTCQSNRFIDNSSNASTITLSGTPTIQRFSPFSPGATYSSSTIGGSGYFDGSGDYLNAPSNAAFNVSTNNVTAEAWVYLTAFNTAGSPYISTIWSLDSSGSNNTFAYIYNTGSIAVGINGVNEIASSAGVIKTGAWYHTAVVRNGSTTTIYVNGVSVATNTTSIWANTGSRPFLVGSTSQSANYYLTGYISNMRFVNGTAVYTSAFTPPTAPVTAIANTSILLNYTNAGIFDNTMMNDLETVGDAKISTAQSKFGGGSMSFDGTGDYLTIPASPNYIFEKDFTIEMWLYVPTGYFQTIQRLVSSGNTASPTGACYFSLGNDNGIGAGYLCAAVNLTSPYSLASGNPLLWSSTLFPVATWTHVALVRSGSSVVIYQGGVSVASVTNTATWNFGGTNGLRISGTGWSSTENLQGYINDFRITKGYARYTSNFTPPTSAFPTY